MKNGNVPKESAAVPTVSSTGKKENGGAAVVLSSALARKVKDIYETMREEGLPEIELKEDNVNVYIRRAGARPDDESEVAASSRGGDDVVGRAPSRRNRAAAARPAGALESKSAPAAQPSGKSIASPINGVFYRSSSPKSPPFVSEGDTVEPGKTLCVIEAMKVMNEIKADSRAKILKILVENGVSVNQGQPIFIVDY